ncbi:MAG TPA: adenylate/guanylate cyclase domain-containing protein [Candidatus Binatia bacterium]|nr:adenylate/guanylate cyclase domain-containing protein [Candidatus Binatia bacterium]
MHDAAIEWLAGLFPVLPARRSRLTVMFTDIVGFTRSTAARGDGAAVRLLHRHDRVTLPAIRAHRGRLVKRLGDGLMVAFALPADALAAALAMQDGLRPRAGFRLRIGIHAGSARTRAGDLIGHDVNVASRIADRAGGGEIVVSDRVRAGAAHLPVHFRKLSPLVIADRAAIALFRVAGR